MSEEQEVSVPADEVRGSVLKDAVKGALGRPAVWLSTWAACTLLALIVALPWHRWFSDAVDHRYEPGTLVALLDQNFRTDNAQGMAVLNEGTAHGGAVLAFVSMLFGVFFAGGWLQIFLERTSGHSLRRFFYGGSRYFWRFFRFFLIYLVVLGFLVWLAYGWPFQELVLTRWLGVPESDHGALDTLDSEMHAKLVTWSQAGFLALLFGLSQVWAIFTRTRLALHDASSALWAGFRAFFTILAHPFKTLLPMFGLLILHALVILLAAWLTGVVDGGLDEESGAGRIFAIFGLSQALPLLWASISRGAQYSVAVQVSREVAPPPHSNDPWSSSIGGPGGPRYPIGGDEYGVSL